MRLTRSHPIRGIALVSLLQLAAACNDREPSGPGVPPAVTGRLLTCEADVRASTLTCAAPSAVSTAPGASQLSTDVILGGQGIYVHLTSSNVSYDASTHTFQADVTVQNLTAVPLGTPDGSTVTGVKVFVYSGPNVVAGAGTVTVANADGTGTFTGTSQPYFLYNQILQTAQVSSAKTWQWAAPSTVVSFTFQVLVDAAAPEPIHAWTTKAAIPTPRVGARVGVANGVLYVVGGQNVSGSALGIVEAYDPVADAWSTKAPMATTRVGVGAGVINGILYAVGGDVSDNGSIVGTLEAYDPATNTWTTKAPMPTPRRSPAVGVINGLLYGVGGGNTIGTTYTTLEAYDPATDTWSTKAPMPTSRWVLGAGVINGVLYAVGGDNGAEPPSDAVPFATVEAYDPATNTWSTKPAMPTARCCFGVGVINGVLYAVGGATNDAATGQLFATVEAYDPLGNSWSTQTALPTPRFGPTVGAIGSALFAVSGFDGTDLLNSTLAFTSYPAQNRLTVALLSAGYNHACALVGSGATYCWGGGATKPVAVAGGLTFVAISAGNGFTCGLTSAGAAYCWGVNGNGQLGDGTRTTRSTPVAVVGGNSFTAITAGTFHTCALTSSGSAYCWGYGFSGQLGNGATADQLTPTLVSGGLTFSAISAGYLHTCGITTSGAAFCWGDNLFGELGNNDGSTTKRTTPVAVFGGLTFSAISANEYYTCGIKTGGAAYCWGYNLKGQLGDGTTTDRLVPVAVAGGLSFASLAPGDGDYHMCAVTSGRGAYCWGDGSFGAIGDGGSTSRLTPTAVAGGLTFAAISTGGSYYTCGRTTAGEAFCWGYNFYGSLGDGTNTDRYTPVPVQSP